DPDVRRGRVVPHLWGATAGAVLFARPRGHGLLLWGRRCVGAELVVRRDLLGGRARRAAGRPVKFELRPIECTARRGARRPRSWSRWWPTRGSTPTSFGRRRAPSTAPTARPARRAGSGS